jgi:UTP--glucose-1-phosphate uridylyltransferase
MGVAGRYILTPAVFDMIRSNPRGAGGEIQLTDAIKALSHEQPVFGYQFTGARHDAGTRLGWLQATIAMALESDEADEVRAFVRGLDLRD